MKINLHVPKRLLGLSLAAILMFFGAISSFAQNAGLSQLQGLFEIIQSSNSYVESLDTDGDSDIYLPVGMKRTVGGMEVAIAINRVKQHMQSSEVGVYARVVIPQGVDGNRQVLFFGVEGVKCSHTGGLPSVDNLKLTLLHDVSIPFNNGNTSIVLKGSSTARSNTYITISCNGFETMALDAEVHFPKSLMVNAFNPNEQLIGRFQTVVKDWDDMLVALNLPDFQIVGLSDYIFSLEDVVLDFSSTRNADGMSFPIQYQNYIPDDESLWRGVYAKRVSLTLPEAFSKTSISAQNMLIDDNGITGIFAADNVLPLEQGSADGWPFSVSHIDMQLVANELHSLSFSGLLQLPFQGKSNTIGYEGFMQKDSQYMLRTKNTDALDIELFQGKMHIDPSSSISLTLKDNKFVPEALLHGNLQIANESLKIPKLTFQSLRISTQEPYLSAQYFGCEGAKLGNFPLSIQEFKLVNSNSKQIKLLIGAELTLGKDQFKGSTQLAISAHYDNNHWQYDNLEIGAIELKANIAQTIELDGKIEWKRSDAVYGDGFMGKINLGVALGDEQQGGKGINVEVNAGFGQKGSTPYWYADGLCAFHPGVPIVGALTLNGLGGGAFSGVRVERGANGASNFIPDSTKGMGFKAAVILEVSKALYGEANFEILFHRSGGLQTIGFYGYAEFPNKGGRAGEVTDQLKQQQQAFPNELSEKFKNAQCNLGNITQDLKNLPNAIKETGLSGTLLIQYDFSNRSLHATTEVYVNSPGNFITGVQGDGLAGVGEMHFDANEWYLHLGTPSSKIGVRLGIGSLSANAGSYFMAGHRIPEMPALPAQVAELAKDIKSNRNTAELSTGRGFAFGADLNVSTGDLTCLIMYANFNAGLGFDVMLRDYSANAYCLGRSGPIGIDGWYAKGQSYAYLQGDLGVKVKLWRMTKKFTVISGGTATVLQAGLPNPSYFNGAVAVNVNILGLIKGNFKFDFSIGEECQIMNANSLSIAQDMINSVSPGDGESEISVFASPEATFNIAVDKSFQITEDDGSQAHYRIQLRRLAVFDKDGKSIDGALEWNAEKTAVKFIAKETLPERTELTAEVRVGFQKWQGGAWQDVIFDGKAAEEVRTHKFTTSDAPNEIPIENIEYCYPVIDQRYFLTEESPNGFVQLKKGQSYLFKRGFDYQLNFYNNAGEVVRANFEYDSTRQRLVFAMPKLKKQTTYALSVSYAIDPQDVLMSATSTQQNNSFTNDELSKKFTGKIGGVQAQYSLENNKRKEILQYAFASSAYATFTEKIQDIKVLYSIAYDASISYTFGAQVKAKEAFDAVEIQGTNTTQNKALIGVRAYLTEDFFVRRAIPLVYDGYPFGNIKLDREEQPIGIPPHKAFRINSTFESDLNSNKLKADNFCFPFTFCAAVTAQSDYYDLRNKVVNRLSTDSPIYKRYVTSSLPVIPGGKYKAKLTYTLPDGTVSSTADFEYKNHLFEN